MSDDVGKNGGPARKENVNEPAAANTELECSGSL